MHSIAEQIRIYTLRSCNETVDRLMQQLDQLASAFEQEEFLPYLPQYRLAAAIAKTCAALAQHDVDAADEHLQTAGLFANQLHRRRDTLTIKVLRAVLPRQRNATQALSLLTEALSLATIGGNARLLADTHPLAVQMGIGLHTAQLRCGPLTPKEAEVLSLLNNGMSNKLIARAMDISVETVTWHLKNLFLKLLAGPRKHVVDRARLLGLVGT